MITQEHQGQGNNINVHGDVIIYNSSKYPTILAEIINILGERLLSTSDEPSKDVILMDKITPETDKINKKIRYNSVKRYKYIFNDYKIYQGKLSKIYAELDKQASKKKDILLKNINDFYLYAKGKYIQHNDIHSEQDIICQYSDDIIDNVKDALLKEIEKSSNLCQYGEIINIALITIILDAFIRCKILEDPTNGDRKGNKSCL
jgi:hypothetical protein